MATKHTTVILPNKEIEDLKDQVKQLTAERDLYQKEAIEAKIKVEKMKLMMDKDKSGVDLISLQKEIDDLLDSETNESLLKWYNQNKQL